MKRACQNAALLLGSCLVAVGGVEMGLRIWGPDVRARGNQNVFYRFDPVLGWDNLPGAEGRFTRSEFSHYVKISASGMRDADVAPKQTGEFRVAVLGDSFAWGVGADYGERFTEVVEARNQSINVLNFGVAGFSPIQYVFQLDKVFPFKPDYVVVALCLGNDIFDNVTYSPYDHPKPYAALSPDGGSYLVMGYPLVDAHDTGPDLIGAGSYSRVIGMIKYAYGQMTRPRGKTVASEDIDERMLYRSEENLSPAEVKATKAAFRINELILADIKRKVEAALGPGRLAVLLAPTKFEVGLWPVEDRKRVGDQV